MKSVFSLFAAAAAAAWLSAAVGGVLSARAEEAPDSPLSWPPLTQECRPWTRWWWMGSAVNPADLTRELTRYQQAGLGGVEITPIYGVKGYENQFIDYLSPQWMDMLKHSVTTAQNLGMGVDMVTGTGWCFGGPNVNDQDGNAVFVVKTLDVSAGGKLSEKFEREKLQALVAFSPEGKAVELTDKIGADGTVDWTAEGGGAWRVYAVSQKFSGQKVKRPAPGGAGPMLNLIYPEAMGRYLQRFSAAFANYPGPKPHGQFHDSYEYQSTWAPDFFQQFEKRRGYRLQDELPALFDGKGDADHVARVKSDYRETVSEAVEQSIVEWTQWCHSEGFVSRNQAHGSPGNWLDIYAASDIPETEMFYKDRDILVSKFASSAAHVTGKNLTGSETGTWVAEHFTETLADLKYLFDDMFLAGVNRITYHGTAYSPDDEPWPGWCFYASTEMNPRNSIWRDVPALNAYAARVQSILQSGKSDNDILLYWPIHDFWHDSKGMLRQFTVHARDWFGDQPIGKTARMLWERGYGFDYISDKQLQNAKFENGALDLFGNQYRVIVVPACEHMPVETLQKLLALANAGAQIIFEEDLPKDAPGLKDGEKRRGELRDALAKIKFSTSALNVPVAEIGKGTLMIGKPSDAWQAHMNAAGEQMAGMGLSFIRRSFDGGWHYFIANRGEKNFDDWVLLGRGAQSAAILDPMTGGSGVAALKQSDGKSYVHLQLPAGSSLILSAFAHRTISGTAWNYWQKSGQPMEITGAWNVKFMEGGPVLPKGFTTEKLASWTELGGEEAQSFAGTALYTLTFDAPNERLLSWSLDLGKVCQSARVRLNGENLGTVFIPPFRVYLSTLKPKGNVLEVELTSVSANRIRDLDRRKVPWKHFYDINVVNLNYKPFDASDWPLTDCGLLGPVTLCPVQEMGEQKKE